MHSLLFFRVPIETAPATRILATMNHARLSGFTHASQRAAPVLR